MVGRRAGDDATGPPSAGFLGIGNALPVPLVNGRPYWEAAGLQRRSSLKECTEEEFVADLLAFLRARNPEKTYPDVPAFPDAVLNNSKLDLWTLYKEVVTRGGLLMGTGIHWRRDVFEKMKNHTADHKQTSLSTTLRRHYKAYLEEYESAHPEDVSGGRCGLCGTADEGADWICCGICELWCHYSCDRRLNVPSLRELTKAGGKQYICPRCAAASHAQE
jgi:hypothetical protein